MTAYQIAKSYFPDFSDADIDYVIWNKTGYPCFWAGTGNGRSDPETVFRRQLLDYKFALVRFGDNVRFCDFCNEPAVKEHNFMLCKSCGDSWSNHDT